MVKLIRYVVGTAFIFMFVSGMLMGVLVVFPNGPLHEFMQSVSSGAPPVFKSFMQIFQLMGIAFIVMAVLCLVIGLVVLFVPIKK
jgi:hypothetical protein